MAYFCCYRPRNYDGQKWKFSSKKKSKFQILSYRRDIYPKRKLRTSTIQIQPEKVWIFAKKIFFFQFFWFSRHARGPPEIFDVHFFESFKKNSKNGFTGSYQTLKGTKSWILVNLAQILWKWQTVFDRLGHNGPPPPPGIGLIFISIWATKVKKSKTNCMFCMFAL